MSKDIDFPIEKTKIAKIKFQSFKWYLKNSEISTLTEVKKELNDAWRMYKEETEKKINYLMSLDNCGIDINGTTTLRNAYDYDSQQDKCLTVIIEEKDE